MHGKRWETYETAISRILSHANNVAETPCEHLAPCVVLDGGLRAFADAESFDHAASRRLISGGGVDVGLGTARHEDCVRVPFRDSNCPGRVCSRVGHARHNLLALPDLPCAGII